MLNLICFSKNRPMQLQAFLDSVEIHTKGFFNHFDVIYKADEEYEKGYDIVKERKPYVNFLKQTDFKKDIMSLFKMDYTCMAADDDIVYKDFNKGLYQMFDNDTACFSLRLGLNIDYCYSNDKPNKIKNYEDHGDFIKWDWKNEDLDFAYPLSVVSHIFRTNEIEALSALEDYNNPNEYEGVLQRHLNKVKPKIVSYKESRIFGVPANRVNDVNQNRNGLKHAYTTEELLDKYIRGWVIDVSAMEYNINAAQQEIVYVFK